MDETMYRNILILFANHSHLTLSGEVGKEAMLRWRPRQLVMSVILELRAPAWVEVAAVYLVGDWSLRTKAVVGEVEAQLKGICSWMKMRFERPEAFRIPG